MIGCKWKIRSEWRKTLIPLSSYLMYSLLLLTVEVEKRYFLEPAISLEPDITITHIFPLPDTISSDTLYEVRSGSGLPIYYFRKINTNVCFDNKCRFLRTNVYWNITGRYLGLEFIEDEFLSKTDHVPFTEPEYLEMNQMLADSLSVLAEYEFEDVVVAGPVNNTGVDGVTSATLPAIRDYVVDGAVFTTLKLWHIIHGPTKRMVENLTSQNLSEDLVLLLLDSPDSYDLVWTIRNINENEKWPATIQAAVADKLGVNYLRSNSILNSIGSRHLDSGFQGHLLQVFLASDYGMKELIVDKLSETERLNEKIAFELIREMPNLQGNLFVKLLELVGKQDWQDIEMYRNVAALLKLPNAFLSGKVYELLKTRNIDDPVIMNAMDNYARGNADRENE